MPIEAVKIPQNVYVEDRIIGPVTLRQLMLVMISGGVSYAIWTALHTAGNTGPLTTAISWTPCVLGAMFAFVRINGISLFRIVLLSLEKLEKPSKRIWTPHRGIYVNITTTTETPRHENPDIERKRQSHENARLEELSHVLDQGPNELTGHYDADDDAAREEKEIAAMSQIKGPVMPGKIRADERNAPASLDGIETPKRPSSTRASGSGLLRDIVPPPATHA